MPDTQNRFNIGLVLEGGAMRGMFTAGVLDAFIRENIYPAMAMGVSAGAVFGVNYIARQEGRVIRYSRRFNSDKRYMGFGSLLKTGNFFNAEFAYGTVPRELDAFDEEAFEKSGIPFYAVATNIETGLAEYIRIENGFDQMDTIRASASMPFFAKPVEIKGGLYLDGGISDGIPIKKMMEMGYGKNIVVLTRPADYERKPASPALIKMGYRKYPALCEAMKNRHVSYNNTLKLLEELEKAGEVFIIRPPEALDVGRIEKDPEKLQAAYDTGVREVEGKLGALREFLKNIE